ncbi:hypothetical protein OK512_11060 [Streptococcus pneumoniae]|nr:hypothetical protein [Streptococcus pneumoniae]
MKIVAVLILRVLLAVRGVMIVVSMSCVLPAVPSGELTSHLLRELVMIRVLLLMVAVLIRHLNKSAKRCCVIAGRQLEELRLSVVRLYRVSVITLSLIPVRFARRKLSLLIIL